MDFDLPPELQAYLRELDQFIADKIVPLQQRDDHQRFFDHRREWARTDFDNDGLPRPEWEALLKQVRAGRRGMLAPGGLLMFSSYGPDTLCELREAWRSVEGERGAARVHEFIDMHDLGDMLGAAGFAAPVMDMERITLIYEGMDALAKDLRASGQGGARADRPRGLVTRRRWSAVSEAYERRRAGGRLPATIEVVYGHAWRAAPRGDDRPPAVSKLEFKRRVPRKTA